MKLPVHRSTQFWLRRHNGRTEQQSRLRSANRSHARRSKRRFAAITGAPMMSSLLLTFICGGHGQIARMWQRTEMSNGECLQVGATATAWRRMQASRCPIVHPSEGCRHAQAPTLTTPHLKKVTTSVWPVSASFKCGSVRHGWDGTRRPARPSKSRQARRLPTGRPRKCRKRGKARGRSDGGVRCAASQARDQHIFLAEPTGQ
jgi:hypothetical protein